LGHHLGKVSYDPYDPLDFKIWLLSRYSKSYAVNIFRYARKYEAMLIGDLRDLWKLSPNVQDYVIKALIALSKYLGIYEEFRSKLKQYGVKWTKQSSFNSFLRILNSSNNDVLEWLREAGRALNPSERIFLRFCLLTGLRKSEAIISFNKIIALSKEGKLSEYYDDELNCLLHFKFSKEFIRRTKNCFISFIPRELLKQIQHSKPVSYNAIRKKLERRNIPVRINELRDFFGTYLLQHGLLEAEVNLLQGRLPASVFIRHYWTPKLSELRDKVLKAIETLQKETLTILS